MPARSEERPAEPLIRVLARCAEPLRRDARSGTSGAAIGWLVDGFEADLGVENDDEQHDCGGLRLRRRQQAG